MVDAVSATSPGYVASGTTPTTPTVSDSQAPPVTAPNGQTKSDDKKNADLSDKALDQIASRLMTPESRLAISRDSVVQRFIYKFVNPDNGKVVQQYPQKMTLNTMYAMEEAYKRFMDERA